jgi:murein DD-endopeptidase MepM/ murein hydrolase activator NlpD
VVIEKYGTYAAGANKTIQNPHKGVKIAAAPASPVHCVFDGTVAAVFNIPGWHTGILVRHGDYFTLYANLATVAVRNGDRVTLNQRLGAIPAGDDPDAHFLEFQISKADGRGGADYQNPESWLRR